LIHPAFGGWAPGLHTYVKMFVTQDSPHWDTGLFGSSVDSGGTQRTNTRWGMQFATLGGTTVDSRLQIVGNVANDIRFDNTTFTQHLHSGTGAIDRLMIAHESQQQGWVYGSVLAPTPKQQHPPMRGRVFLCLFGIDV